ncbi:MAG: hypothetical protein ACXVCP_09515 [Bdellovibrio sp.]
MKSIFNKLGSLITNTMMTLIVTSPHIAYAIGGQDGGGTTGSYNNSGQLVSYDILSKDPNFKDDQQVPNINLENNLTGFIKKQREFGTILRKITNWSHNSPLTTFLLTKALEQGEFYLVENEIEFFKLYTSNLKENQNLIFQPPYDVPMVEKILHLKLYNPKLTLVPVAKYQTDGFFYINKTEFNKLGTLSRQATYLKEAIRRVQNILNDSDLSNIDFEQSIIQDQIAQDLVYKILMTEPTNKESLDSTFLNPGLSFDIERIVFSLSRQSIEDLPELKKDLDKLKSIKSIHCSEYESLWSAAKPKYIELKGEYDRASLTNYIKNESDRKKFIEIFKKLDSSKAELIKIMQQSYGCEWLESALKSLDELR